MIPPGRSKGEFRRAQPDEGTPVSTNRRSTASSRGTPWQALPMESHRWGSGGASDGQREGAAIGAQGGMVQA